MSELKTKTQFKASDEKMQTPVIQICQIIIKTDYFELLSMLSVTIVSSLMDKKRLIFFLVKQKLLCNILLKMETNG